ncbi:MAG: AAA family ATPase [Pseudomonadota bacterium]
MDPIRNPFAPGAGTRPPELAGRDEIIRETDIALQRTVTGKNARSGIFLGLRGTGKTVLLTNFESLAEDRNHLTAFIEAPENNPLSDLLYPKIYQILRRLSLIESAKSQSHKAFQALRGFAAAFNIKVGDVSISVDPEPGYADSGDLEMDLPDLFVRVGDAAKAAGKGVTFLVDELQYLSKTELSAIIVALHRVNQKTLPVLFLGAGLPQIAGLTGNAKSYAERLFSFTQIGPLSKADAAEAIRAPIESQDEKITEAALDAIYLKTDGYPYFLQEWGYQAWNSVETSPIRETDVIDASQAARARLDDGFFRVRFDRLTPKEREYVVAMAALGDGPYRSSEIAEKLQEKPSTLGPRRAKIIHKGMIYSPNYGDIDFTVPMFADFLRRLDTAPTSSILGE